jgi:small subunit ribosomal protein S20
MQGIPEVEMPNIKSAKKRMVLSRKWAARNRHARTRIRTAVKKVLQTDDPGAAKALLSDAVSLLDRAGRKRLLHPNRVARIKSRLQNRINRLSAG